MNQQQAVAIPTLCFKCRGLCENGVGWCWARDVHGHEYPSGYIHHPNLHVLKTKADEGCALCSIIVKILSGYRRLSGATTREGSEGRCQETDDDTIRIVSQVQDLGIIQPITQPPTHRTKQTQQPHNSVNQKKVEQLRSVLGPTRIILRPQIQNSRDTSATLPNSLSVNSLALSQSNIAEPFKELGRIRILVNHGMSIVYPKLQCPYEIP